MSKYQTASFSLYPAAILSHIFPDSQIFLAVFVETPFLTKRVLRVTNARIEVRKSGSNSKVISEPFFFQFETQSVSYQCFIDFQKNTPAT